MRRFLICTLLFLMMAGLFPTKVYCKNEPVRVGYAMRIIRKEEMGNTKEALVMNTCSVLPILPDGHMNMFMAPFLNYWKC